MSEDRLDRIEAILESTAVGISDLRDRQESDRAAVAALRSTVEAFVKTVEVHKYNLEAIAQVNQERDSTTPVELYPRVAVFKQTVAVSQRNVEAMLCEIAAMRTESQRILAHIFGPQWNGG